MDNIRYFIKLAYNGTDFHGWQLQPNAHTVQHEIQNALSILNGSQIHLTGAGRTDTGVHARNFYAHFDSEVIIENSELSRLVPKLNSFLPPSIVVLDAYRVKPDIHARFSALSRTYRYYISRHKDPFSIEFSWNYTSALDMDTMNEAAKSIFDYTDFTCFSKSRTQTKTNDCSIYESYFILEGNILIYHIKANRFLRNMVRAIVGTLIEVGKGKTDMNRFKQIIENGTRSDAGMSVPACGLFLEDIEYPADIRL